MARRMYDLDNGTENIKVDDLVVNGTLTVTGGYSGDYIIIGTTSVGNPDYVRSAAGFDLMSGSTVVLSITSTGAFAGRRFQFKNYETASRPTIFPSTGAGSVIYDSDLGKLILWNGTAWVNLDGTPLGE